MSKDKETTGDLLFQAGREIEMASTVTGVFSVGQRWWSTMVRAGQDADQIRKLDRLIAVRLDSLQQLNPRETPSPKVEKGQYVAPTPRIGERVVWFQANDGRRMFAADVVNVERPGQVQLRLIKSKGDAFGAPDHVLGVRHRSDPVHESASNHVTTSSGSWDYLLGDKVPDSHYLPAREEIRVREANTIGAEAKQKEREQAIREQADAARQAVLNLQV